MKIITILLSLAGSRLGQRLLDRLAEAIGIDVSYLQELIQWLKTLNPAQRLAVSQILLPQFKATPNNPEVGCDLPDCPHNAKIALEALRATDLPNAVEVAVF